MHVLSRLFVIVLAVMGAGLAIAGGWLISLGGSWYYFLLGLVWLIAAVAMWRGRTAGGWLVIAAAVLTVPWAIWEAGLAFWPLFTRLMVPIAVAGVAALFMPTLADGQGKKPFYGLAALALVLFVLGFVFTFQPHGVVQRTAEIPTYVPAKGDNTPSDWTAYARDTMGRRYSPFDQINRDTVSKLDLAWTFRTGRKDVGIDQNTPLQIGDTVYSCTTTNVVIALDPDKGTEKWRFDPQVKDVFWQRCRGIGYFKLPEAQQVAGQACNERLILTTVDARLIAIDAKDGKLCEGFGQSGVASLGAEMGDIKPGYYFQTSAPLVARDKIVVGGWVVDNQEVGEPSGVIRAFNAVTGELEWAWDLGNPAITKLPPPGETYTRETPNMWTTAAYDDELGLIYAPLGNTTPDYYGADRPAFANEYNATLVALDVETGRERWKFQTVHHDLWDYDLPSQPALIDVPDGKGGVVKAVLQTTKRAQLFLLDRATGEPIAEVAELPVPQEGAAPEEIPHLSPTQPFSVGMPTIGAETLTEAKMWGMTTFDQLICRIEFRQMQYFGNMTPIGVNKPTIEQPGNLGGFNWGSVSVDVPNNLVFMNDIRVPTKFWLMPSADYPAIAKELHSDGTGHGPSPQRGTPYGMATDMWLSPLGVPCVAPPLGTITAVDMNTRTVAWSVPAGTAEQLGPFGLKLGLKMPMGMPTYAGTTATAGGLVFFAGFQDYYLRAYDAATGEEVWNYELPVGSSATPMTYVSPATGKQYVLISVGGAARSPVTGDYVMAFALKD
ncbi:MAG: membrane-bound PQQ-dependent dehydrogenase, glucose/quinate/shikimate family [Rhodobacteraceae bacterium]|jgi:quinate dehydrogenase (quinone)|nr:membrane-bound PQQ-dependent dehydrogenase, glucose/quinate/shikimate family [Paracoccaceae bacterium]